MYAFLNGTQLPLPKTNIWKKVSVSLGHGAWHDDSLSGNYTFPDSNGEYMILNEKMVKIQNGGVTSLLNHIAGYATSKVMEVA